MTELGDIAVICGLDMGKGEHHAHAVTRSGKTVLNKKLPNSESKLRAGRR